LQRRTVDQVDRSTLIKGCQQPPIRARNGELARLTDRPDWPEGVAGPVPDIAPDELTRAKTVRSRFNRLDPLSRSMDLVFGQELCRRTELADQPNPLQPRVRCLGFLAQTV